MGEAKGETPFPVFDERFSDFITGGCCGGSDSATGGRCGGIGGDGLPPVGRLDGRDGGRKADDLAEKGGLLMRVG